MAGLLLLPFPFGMAKAQAATDSPAAWACARSVTAYGFR